ncbi:GNAT family N-acetyltransferase [Pontibacter korlensis]|uniref:BioF2-like acetyltransferase domain-containing protein n=1 Tax=Pontibacter korlensis TaxID=400092 RepID=A0A0E3ZHD2_9BACT|nr:GNAT family N-acetyltransferase [Pontibacter korlensis]AKD04394.1 hypothetical protein PKOR_16510 [Pontibacter korlensis]
MQDNTTYEVVKVSYRAVGVEVVIGEGVYDLLNNITFQSAWDNLLESCAWSTVFQSRSFVSTWYNVYQNEYLPILVKNENEGELIGLLAMALPLSALRECDTKTAKGRIVGAGQYEAEYQTWLALESNGESFIQDALSAMRKQFPLCEIQLRYLPPNTPIGWAMGESKWVKRVVLQPSRRPLMDMGMPDFSKLFKKSEYRNKLNRLKKLGLLHFERITDFETFSAILPELTVQYDFRQGAMFNKNQFRENSSKQKFLLELFEQDLLHVSVLRAGNELLASIVAIAGKKWVHLGGINIHSPFNAHYYSPGFVNFLMLGQQLAQEGYAVFDLTPGGDAYKERMATRHDHVYELVVTSSFTSHFKRRLKKHIHDRMVKTGVRPMSVELSLRKKKYLLKERLKALKQPRDFLRFINQLAGSSKKTPEKLLKISLNPATATSTLEVNANNLSDLLNYEPAIGCLTRWEFLEDAMRRFEVGETSYTWSLEGKLMACVWHSGGNDKTNNEQAATVLHSIYLHPFAQDRLGEFLLAVGRKASEDKQNIDLYLLSSPSLINMNNTLEEWKDS